MEAHLDWAGEIRVMLISGNRGRALLMLLAATKSLLSVKVISLLLFEMIQAAHDTIREIKQIYLYILNNNLERSETALAIEN